MKTVYKVNVENFGILLYEKLFFKYGDAKKYMDEMVIQFKEKYDYEEDEILEYYDTDKNVFLRVDDGSLNGLIVWQIYINETTVF